MRLVCCKSVCLFLPAPRVRIPTRVNCTHLQGGPRPVSLIRTWSRADARIERSLVGHCYQQISLTAEVEIGGGERANKGSHKREQDRKSEDNRLLAGECEPKGLTARSTYCAPESIGENKTQDTSDGTRGIPPPVIPHRRPSSTSSSISRRCYCRSSNPTLPGK